MRAFWFMVVVVMAGCTSVSTNPDASVVTLDVEVRAICLGAGCDAGIGIILHAADFITTLGPLRWTTCGADQRDPLLVVRRARYIYPDGGFVEQPEESALFRGGTVEVPRLESREALYTLSKDLSLTPSDSDVTATFDGGTWTVRYPLGRGEVGVEEVIRLGDGRATLVHTWVPTCTY